MTSILRTHLMHACMPSPALHSGPRLTWAVKMLFECTALLNLELRGFWTLASAHVLTLTTSYLCLSISGAFWGLQGFQKCQKWSGSLEVNLELSIVQREWEHRGQMES